MYNPREDSMREGLPLEISRTLRKRHFLIEKAKNSNIIGGSCAPVQDACELPVSVQCNWMW